MATFIVWNEALTKEKRGKTVLSESERIESLKHCKWVDQVIEQAPWTITKEFMDEHAVSLGSMTMRSLLITLLDDVQIDFVVQQSLPSESKDTETYQAAKDGGKLLASISEDSHVSTNDLLSRILQDYNLSLLKKSGILNSKSIGLSAIKASTIIGILMQVLECILNVGARFPAQLVIQRSDTQDQRYFARGRGDDQQ